MGIRRSHLQIAAAAVLSIAVVTFVAGALWVIGSASGERDQFSSLDIAPADSVFYMAINTEPSSSQWIAVSDTLDKLNAKEPIREAIDEQLLQFGLQFERDILPLSGDEGYMAVTDVDALADNAGSGFVIAFRLRDQDKAEGIFLDIAQNEGTSFTEEDYEGVTIRQAESLSPGEQGAISFVENIMVVGLSNPDVKGVIDVIQGRAASAQTNARLIEMRERQEDDFLAWGYADLGQLWDVLEQELQQGLATAGQDVDQIMEQARANDRLSFSISATGDGFTADASVLLAPGAEVPPGYGGRTFDSKFAEMVPEDTLFFYAGYDPYNAAYLPAKDTLEQFTPEGSNATVQEELSRFEDEIGFDLENDLLSLLTGEYAIAFNGSDFESSEPELNILALLEVNDSARMNETMGKIEAFLEREQIATVEDSETAGIRRWSSLDSPPETIAWTQDEGRLAFGYPEAAVEEFAAGVSPSLADNEDWRRTMGLMPDDTSSIMFVSLGRVLEEIQKNENVADEFATSTDHKVTLDDLAPIRSFAMASTPLEDGYGLRMAVFIAD
jgi:Protein of unknown function (DUF3352)